MLRCIERFLLYRQGRVALPVRGYCPKKALSLLSPVLPEYSVMANSIGLGFGVFLVFLPHTHTKSLLSIAV